MLFAVIDVETTGGNAYSDKITEIAIYLHDGNSIVDEFSTLVNPECSIPPFIERLTGINDEMVSNAPKFYEVAKEIVRLTEGATFVAHNALFDYSFIRQEFKSLGYTFSRDYLCTVKMSRKLIPGYRSYSLGTLCSELGIKIENRHRAPGDALATVKLLELLIEKNLSGTLFDSFVRNDYLDLRFPPGFDKKILDQVPEAHGVYYFYDEDGQIIYIGKSNNIRKRMLSHFSNKQTRKAIELRNTIRDISFEATGNELIALLLESDEIKRHQPRFNRAQRNTIFNHGIFGATNESGYTCLKAAKVKSGDEPLITMRTADDAQDLLEKIILKYKLCQKLCGLYDIKHACFHYNIKQCNGACIGKEPVEEYNQRVNDAILSFQYKNPNFMIVGSGRKQEEKSVVHVEHGKYMGFGYFDTSCSSGQIEELRDAVKLRPDNRDVHKILRHYLLNAPNHTVLTY